MSVELSTFRYLERKRDEAREHRQNLVRQSMKRPAAKLHFEDCLRQYAPDPFEAVAQAELIALFQEMLSRLFLSDRHREVIELRFGFRGRDFTLEEVAERLGVNRERARMIEAEALRRLRHPSRAKHLRPFYIPARSFRWGRCAPRSWWGGEQPERERELERELRARSDRVHEEDLARQAARQAAVEENDRLRAEEQEITLAEIARKRDEEAEQDKRRRVERTLALRAKGANV